MKKPDYNQLVTERITFMRIINGTWGGALMVKPQKENMEIKSF